MYRGGIGGGMRNMGGGVRRPHICTECGKSFRTGEDLFMHAEVCLLDAFEMEATAMHAGDVHRRSVKRQSGAGDGDHKPSTGSRHNQSGKRSHDVAATEVVQTANESGDPDLFEDEVDDESEVDYEPPPELELAEPVHKKYKRAFPIGDDGKQIRPKMECPTCGLVLYRHNFSTHFRIHTGELPFQCSFCDKRFRTSSALTVHTRCHTGERPYECPHCNYCCITKRNLDRHIINNHVKKNSKTGRISREYYLPRARRVGFGGMSGNLEYEEELDDDMEEDIDDENLGDLELEEEAEISKAVANLQQGQQAATPAAQGDEGEPVEAAADASPKEGTSTQQLEQPPTTDQPASPAKRMPSVPILDGPTGVYGEPETEEIVETSSSPHKNPAAKGKEAEKESQPQEASK